MQSIGDVLYGSYLNQYSVLGFTFLSSLVTALFFFVTGKNKGVGHKAFYEIIALNLFTLISFISFYGALQFTEVAVVSAIEIGIAPFLAIIFSLFHEKRKIKRKEFVITSGILLGSIILIFSALNEYGLTSAKGNAIWGVCLSLVNASSTLMIIFLSKKLVAKQWSSGAILTHRFYLIILFAGIFSVIKNELSFDGSISLLLLILGGITLFISIPFYLFQKGIKYESLYKIALISSLQPIISMAIQPFVPRYTFSWTTAIGVIFIAIFVLIDTIFEHKKATMESAED